MFHFTSINALMYLFTCNNGRRKKMDAMASRLDTLATMLSLEALLETGNTEKALEIIKEIIKEAKNKPQ
jgi:hypothetical protein